MTSRFARRALSMTGAAALTLITALAPQAAFADTEPAPPPAETTSAFMPMEVLRYDAKVAAENGYEIVTEADGSQHSTPVTPEAIAQQREFDDLKRPQWVWPNRYGYLD